jgi:DNA-binding MarR family transcriptional regulator
MQRMPSARKTTPAPRAEPAPKARPAAKPAARRVRAPPPADSLDPFDLRRDSLGYLLRRAQVHAYGLFFEMLGSLELSPARLTALSVIAGESNINQAALARRLGVAGPSVMKLIDALEGAGFIRRMDVASDRRRYSLVLTASGRAVLQTLQKRHAAYEQRLAKPLSAAEREQLMALLNRLIG